MANGVRKPFGDRYATIMIGVFCTLGSMVYVTQLPFQYPFAHKSEVAALKTAVKENSVQTAAAAEQATTATTTAVKAEKAANTAKGHEFEIYVQGQAENSRRIAQLRKDVNQIKRRLGIP